MSMPLKDWRRLGYPPASLLCVGVLVLLSSDFGLVCLLGSLGWQLDPADRAWMSSFLDFPMLGAIVGAALLGLYRANRFPTLNSEYAQWMLRTPWVHTQRTPFGPWRPIASDLLVLGGLSAFGLAHAVARTSFALPGAGDMEAVASWSAAIAGPWLAFGLAWAARGYAKVCQRWKWDMWVIAICAGAGANAFSHEAAELLLGLVPVCGLLLFVTTSRRLWLVLRELPGHAMGESVSVSMSKNITAGTYNILAPEFDRPSDERRSNAGDYLPLEPKMACAIGSVVFVWLMAFVEPTPSASWYRSMAVLVAGMMTLPALAYASLWGAGTGSHLGPSARWATKRLIVWEYDKIWLIPILVMPLVTSVVLWGGWYLLPAICRIPLGVSAGLTVGIMVGPNRKRWLLTAPLRYARPTQSRRRSTGNSSQTSRT